MDQNDGTGHQWGDPNTQGTQPLFYTQPSPGVAPQPQYAYAPQPPRRSGRNGGGWKIALAALVSGVIGALLVLLVLPLAFGVNPYDLVRGKLRNLEKVEKSSTIKETSFVVSPTQGASDVTTVAKKVTPSIVNIDVRTTPQQTPFFTTQAQEGTGSGVIFSADGYIITNNHVVEGAQDITVTLASGEELKAKVVGTDPENDIAVVKVDKSGLPALSVGDSDDLAVGQLVVAVGSPLGFEQTVTAGIVSALHRNVAADSQSGQATVLTDMIQTDAPINPGNSGGALCDANGNLIGINTLIASQSGGSEGIGFSIPIDTAKKVADDLIAGRAVSHPYIGIQGKTITSDVASRYNLPASEGAYVSYVTTGSPAAKAGIKQGDIVVEADGQGIKSVDDLIAAVRKKNVGDKMSVTYYQGDGKKTAELTVEEEPSSIR